MLSGVRFGVPRHSMHGQRVLRREVYPREPQ